MAGSTDKNEYVKRPGTSGIRGHLYETKLLSLIYFRAIHDDNIEQFHLATNVDKLGSLDDICFRAKIKGHDHPLTVFIQAKHRENNSVTINNKSDLEKHFKSYLEIRHKFRPGNEDIIFRDTFRKSNCLFVIYTTANGDKNSTLYEGTFAQHLNYLIATADYGTLPCPAHDSHDVIRLCNLVLENQMHALARKMAKWIYGEINDSQELLKDDLVLRYHVILAKTIFDVSDEQSEGSRIAHFKDNFSGEHRKDSALLLFQDELCTEILKRRKFDDGAEPCAELDQCMFTGKSDDIKALYRHIASIIIYKNRQFEYIDKTSSEKHNIILNKINSTPSTKRRALKQAVSEYLPPGGFKVPAWFGNKDLTIRGDDKKQERKLNDLKSKIVGLIKKSEPSRIVLIDESMGKGFLQLSGGLASAVGNLLVYESYSKTFKFTNNYNSLGNLAKRLYDKLQGELTNLKRYRFDIKVPIFPKFSFTIDEYNKGEASNFFDNLLFYTSQLKEKKVEETLIYEISKSLSDDVQNEEITSNAIYLKYHDNIQKWWMTPNVGTYLTKEGILYKDAVKYTTSLPLTSVMSMMEKLKNKHYMFNKDSVLSINLPDKPSGTIIVTDNIALTIAKVAKQFNKKDFIVLDLKYILNLTSKDDKILQAELMNMKEPKIVIIDFRHALQTKNSLRSARKLHEFAKSIQGHKYVIIADQQSVIFVEEYFPNANNVVNDESYNLTDMSEDSQTDILENTQVIFQGNGVALAQVIDKETVGYVGGSVLNKLMQGDLHTLKIGKSIRNSNYRQKLYIDRKLNKVGIPVKEHKINNRSQSYFDIFGMIRYFSSFKSMPGNLIVIVGDAGIGKSTWLTHLSYITKESDPASWIVRINLLEYSWQFSEWQDSKKLIDTTESVKFLCQVAVSGNCCNYEEKVPLKITLDQSNGLFHLKDCKGDDWTVFELKMFLHYYNTKQVLILLDGFDEICPMYENEVTAFINALQYQKWQPDGHKLCITSRTVGKLESFLTLEMGMVYQIEPLSGYKQHDYLITYWDEKDLLKDLNEEQFLNICDFVTFMSHSDAVYVLIKKHDFKDETKNENPFLSVYLSLVKYLRLRLDNPRFHNFESYERIMDILTKLSESILKVKFDKFVAIPLHLNMLAEYLLNKIRNTDKISNKWDLDTNIFDIYEGFFETKLKIRFQEKNRNDFYTPDNKADFKKRYADFLDKHKKLGAYAVFDKSLFDEDELKNIVGMVHDLKMDDEKTGVIANVVNDTPVFIHSTFAEFFAAAYLYDLFKSNVDRRSIWSFVLNVMFIRPNAGFLVLFDVKMKTDEELTTFLKEDKDVIYDLLMDPSKNAHGDIKSSLLEVVRHNLRTLGMFLLSTIEENLTVSRLMDFITIVKETKIVIMAIKMEFEEIIVNIVNLVKKLDGAKLIELFENVDLNKSIDDISTDEIIRRGWTLFPIGIESLNLVVKYILYKN